jgi:hypothetical protein
VVSSLIFKGEGVPKPCGSLTAASEGTGLEDREMVGTTGEMGEYLLAVAGGDTGE